MARVLLAVPSLASQIDASIVVPRSRPGGKTLDPVAPGSNIGMSGAIDMARPEIVGDVDRRRS